MINSFLQLIVFVFAVWCLVIVIKAIVDNPDARCQYGNCDGLNEKVTSTVYCCR